VFLVPLLVGTDGSRKMSKSLGNYVGVTDAPEDMYGKVMSIPDNLIADYFELLTDVPDEEISQYKKQMDSHSINPMVVKKRLAHEIVILFHGAEGAGQAEEHFTKVFQKGEMPEEVVPLDVTGGVTLSAELTRVGLTKSRSEARRLLSQGAIQIDDETVTEDIDMVKIGKGKKIKVGKRRFAST
jgi:tyrosyl-tRNA synthetase